MTNSATPIFCILGPTGSGKTALALELAQTLPIEIISVDSALVYKGPALVRAVNAGLVERMSREGLTSLRSVIGRRAKELAV
mgnify:CR=1 FL=1